MFDLLPNLLSSIPTFLFPVFASYKALKTSDPALLTPWLMYWVVLAIVLFIESWVGWFLVWLPFYGYFRLGFLLYLILPQTQGAKVLYQKYVHPWLQQNENTIDRSISEIHAKIKASGLIYIQQAIEMIKQSVFGIPPKPRSPPPTPGSTYASYATNLISQFNMASARPQQSAPGSGSSGTAGDFYSLLASAVTAATGASGSTERTRDLSNSGTLIPPHVDGSERLNFISTQRDRLTTLLSALDREASTLQGQGGRNRQPSYNFDGSESGHDGLSTRKSEPDFERIDTGVDAHENGRRPAQRGHSASGSWLPWSWAGGRPNEGDSHGRSTGLEY